MTTYQPQAVPQRATGAFVCGIVGAVCGLIPLLFLPAGILGIIATALGASGWRQTPRARLARAAVVLGLLAITLAVVGFVIVDNAVSDLGSDT